MFVNMAFVVARPGKEEELAEVMRSFGQALQGHPGLLGTHVLAEKGGHTLVGISMWTDETAFQQGMTNVQAAPPRSLIESLRQEPPTMRQFVEI